MDRIYAHPRAYDLAFSYRDFPLEVSKLIDWYMEVTETNSPPGTMLELACGPARYPMEFSRRGVRATGLDLSEEMCAYAITLAQDSSADIRIERADMLDFDLQTQFDLVILMLNSLNQITSEEALRQHFRSVHRNLSEKGVYVIESGRPESIEAYEETEWEAEWTAESGEDRLRIRWGADGDFEYAFIAGTLAGEEIHLEDKSPGRRWRTAEIMDAARSAGLSLVGHFRDFSGDSTDEVAQSIPLSAATDLGLHHCFCFNRTGSGERYES